MCVVGNLRVDLGVHLGRLVEFALSAPSHHLNGLSCSTYKTKWTKEVVHLVSLCTSVYSDTKQMMLTVFLTHE